MSTFDYEGGMEERKQATLSTRSKEPQIAVTPSILALGELNARVQTAVEGTDASTFIYSPGTGFPPPGS